MANPETAGAEERIAVLEQKCRDMDALVKGLLDELLDLKSVSKKLSLQAGQYARQEISREPEVEDTVPAVPATRAASQPVSAPSQTSTIIHTKAASQPEAPAAEPEPEMVRIMQPDGTMKMEVRRGDSSTTSSSAGYGRDKKSTSLRSSKPNRS